MGLITRYLAFPRPQTFLHFMSLRTGVELISLVTVFNKATGLFGLLAVLTGFHLSPLQLSMYIYSILALIILTLLTPHIRSGSPFQNLALAYFYVLDTVVNTAFTSAFALTWFLAVSADQNGEGIPKAAPGSGMIDDTAGFTSPKYNVSKVDVVIDKGKETVALVGSAATAMAARSPTITHGVGVEESIPSLFLVGLFTLMRLYCVIIVMAYARQVLRSHVYNSTHAAKLHLHTDGAVEVPAENPFREENEEGQGWKGKLGRWMVGVGENYWLGGIGEQDANWVKGLDGRFRSNRVVSNGPPGTLERERRARSGTGPPKPLPELKTSL